MSEINIGMQQMYEGEIAEKQRRRTYASTTILAVVFVFGIGMLMPAPANWYVWIMGSLGIGVLRELL